MGNVKGPKEERNRVIWRSGDEPNSDCRLRNGNKSFLISRFYAMRRTVCPLCFGVTSGGNREATGFLSLEDGLYYPLIEKDARDGWGRESPLFEKFHIPDPREK